MKIFSLGFAAIAASTLFSCSTPPGPEQHATRSPTSATQPERAPAAADDPSSPWIDAQAAIDRIVVRYGPKGDPQGADAETVEIRDPAIVDRWIATLSAVPETPARGVRMVSFLPETPEHRVEFYAGDALREVRRLKGGQLDVAAHPGWAFYSGRDAAFAELVTDALPDDGE